MTNPLVAFYEGTGTDDRVRRPVDYWNFSHDELEGLHDYIQWLFPLRERSAFNPDAPVLDDATIARFRSDAVIRRNMQRSLAVMRGFYEDPAWLRPGNHNYLRLTRILKSLSLVGLEGEAQELLARLEEIYVTRAAVIGSRTLDFWRRAVG